MFNLRAEFWIQVYLILEAILLKKIFFVFLGPHPQHMEVPRLGVKSELQLLAYNTATATQNPSHICNLHHSLQPCQISNPLSEARDWIQVITDTSQVCYHEPQQELPKVHSFNQLTQTFQNNSWVMEKEKEYIQTLPQFPPVLKKNYSWIIATSWWLSEI